MDNILSPGGIQCEALCTLCTRTVIYLREYSAGHCVRTVRGTVRCLVTYSAQHCMHCVYTLCAVW